MLPRYAGALFAAALGFSAAAGAADYVVDPAHSFVAFKIRHLGYSWLHGRFNGIEGRFKYDANAPADSNITVTIDTTSVDTNHAERDKHLRGTDFLAVDRFATATFTSTGFSGSADKGVLSGVLRFHGVEKSIQIPLSKVGEGPDPWGGYRAGFVGNYTMTRADFGLDYDLGPSATTVELELGIEGVRQ